MKLTYCLLACLLAASATGETMLIRSDKLEVTCDPAAGTFRISMRDAAKPFISAGRFAGQGGTGKTTQTIDKTFGKGPCIEVVHQDGRLDRIALFDGLPFAIFASILKNGSPDTVVVNHVPLAEFDLDLGKPPADLRVLGTGGLDQCGKDSRGSYMWLAIADPQTRRGIVGGWISTERGSGVVFPDARDGVAKMNARVEHGRLQLPPGKEVVLDSFAIGLFDDARLGLEAWADTVAKVYNIHLPPQPVGYCTWYHAGSWNEKGIAQQADFAGKNLQPWGFSVVQIDDGWQDGHTRNGPRKNFTKIHENGPYKSGMKATADKIKSAGLVPGIWLMPFSGSPEDPWYKDHLDWFVKQPDGKPHESPWGGACLDMTHPGAREYVRDEIKRIVKDWGYQYLKMDGLTSGAGVRHIYVNDGYRDDKMGDSIFHDPAKTNIEAFRDGLRLVREAAGPDVYLLGCCVAQNMRSYGGAIGLLDANRIGPDNGPSWDSIPTGPRYGTRNYHLHGRIWHNDPDCIYARPSVPMNQAQLLATWATLSGQLSLSSEEFSKLPPERLDLLRRTMPAHGLPARPVDLFETPLPRIWLVSDSRAEPSRHAVGLFNWDNAETTIEYPLAKLGLAADQRYVAFDYWQDKLAGPFEGKLVYRVPGRSCAALSLRAVQDHPMVISTSHHITQGMVDLSDEKWDAAKQELSGASRVVAGDPYELRLVTAGWKAQTIGLTGTPAKAGEFQLSDGLARVRIESAQSGLVKWTVRFAPAK